MIIFKSIFKVVFLTLILSFIPTIVSADVVMGIFPRRPAAATVAAFTPLANRLSKVLGEKVRIVAPKNFRVFWKDVKQNRFDLVHYNQFQYIKSHKEQGYKVIAANEEFGKSTIAGAIAVRTDSGINSIADLKGKTILFGGGKMAMTSYIATTGLLKKNGLAEGKDYKVRFAANPPSAVIGVYNNAAQAAGTGDIALKVKAIISKIDASKMKILAKSDRFIEVCWAVNKSMPADEASRIQQAMTTLKGSSEGKQILKVAHVTNFVKATDADFNKVREIARYAMGKSY